MAEPRFQCYPTIGHGLSMIIGNSRILTFRSDRIVIKTPLISISLYSFSIGIIISTYSDARKFTTRI
jgi:hypothetical protein